MSRSFFILAVAMLAIAAAIGAMLPRITVPPDRFQIAYSLLQDARAGDAAVLFEEPEWQGIAEYRAGRYRQALGSFFNDEKVRTIYNMGNSYARLQEWTGAKAAYRKVLRLEPDHEDAQHNLNVILRAEEREKELLEAERQTKRLGRWRDGNLEGEPEEPENSNGKTEKGGTGDGTLETAKSATDKGGNSDQVGMLGTESIAADAGAGVSEARGDEDTSQDLHGSGGRAVVLKESEQAAEILLRRIKDNPARVLAARFRSIRQARAEGQQ